MKKSIKDWSEQDRPREKLLNRGVKALTDAEIIAILLASGNRKKSAVELSQEILEHYNNDLNKLGRCNTDELTLFQGVGTAKALTLVAALELGRRRKEVRKELIELQNKELVEIGKGRQGTKITNII